MATSKTETNTPVVHDLVVPTPKHPGGRLMYLPKLVGKDNLLDVGSDRPYDRGYKKYRTVIELREYDEDGIPTHRSKYITAPANGYVVGLPDQARYVEPGEVLGQLTEGYVYRRNPLHEDRTGFQKWKQIRYYKRPSLQHFVHMFYAALVLLAGYLPFHMEWLVSEISGILLVVGVPYFAVSLSFLIFGGKRIGLAFTWMFETLWFRRVACVAACALFVYHAVTVEYLLLQVFSTLVAILYLEGAIWGLSKGPVTRVFCKVGRGVISYFRPKKKEEAEV